MSVPLLSVNQLHKSFGAVHALSGANLTVEKGQILGLVGENGAGKSTLIKILSGVHVQDSGEIVIDGENLRTGSVSHTEKKGICVVHQESTAFRDLGLVENLFVGHEPTRFFGMFLDKRAMQKRACEWMAAIGQEASFDGTLSERSLAQQQLVAIARAIATDCRVLILDEPTASLSTKEVEVLSVVVRGLAKKGVAIIYVSHRLEEIFDLCDVVTVMRDGETVAHWRLSETSREQLITAMVGREVTTSVQGGGSYGQVRLKLNQLSKKGQFENVSFEVHEGEIVGLGGLVGSGRSEVANTIFGVESPDFGTVEVNGKQLKLGSIRVAMQAGIALVPEDRQHQGLVLELPVFENLLMSVRKRFARWGLLNGKKERAIAREGVASLQIKVANTAFPASSLSGGNQQKVVLSKWLSTSPTVLIVDEPTRGVDVGSKAEIHAILRKIADEGASVLVVSSDLPELLHLSDRIIVLREGKLSGELSRHEASPESVLQLALGEVKT